MNLTDSEAGNLAADIKDKLDDKYFQKIDVLLCSSFVSLIAVKQSIENSKLRLGAQDIFYENDGPYTGEISGSMLLSAGCEYVIVGHSERRKYFYETNVIVNKKIKKSLEFNLLPILCVGETIVEREDEIFEGVIEEQIIDSLEGVSPENIKKIIIAYEPVWAIGTGVNATPAQSGKIHKFIRTVVAKIYDSDTANNLLIIYGGSLNGKNAHEMLSEPGIDGALIGGASLDAEQFKGIVKTAYKIRTDQ